ncbi:MAG: peptidylprolyl isomerase [bacterium]
MNKYLNTLLILMALPVILSADKKVVDGIVAVVNGTPITLYQVEQRANILEQKYPDAKDLKKKALNDLIDDVIVYDELKTMGATVNEADVDNAIEQMVEANGISLDALKSDLQSKGISFSAYKDEIKSELAKTKLVNFKFRSEITITDDDIQRYYLAHKKEFSQVKQANISHILIQVPIDASKEKQAQLLQLAKTVFKKIENGETFTDAALKYSDDKYTKDNGGYLGYVDEGSLYPVLNSAIFKARPGEIIGPIKTPVGYEIIQVNGFRSSQLLPLKDVKDRIRNDIYNEKLDATLKKWLLTKKEKTIITIYNEIL